MLEHELMMEPRLIVRGRGDDQRAFGTQLHVNPRYLLHLDSKGWPSCLALAAERDQRPLARLCLAASCQHAGGGMAGGRAGHIAIEYFDCGAARGEPPTDTQANNAGADDGDLRFADADGAIWQPAAPLAANEPKRLYRK
jgi:hypothetical protein